MLPAIHACDKDCSLQQGRDSVGRSAGYSHIFSFWEGSLRKNHLEQLTDAESGPPAFSRMTYCSQIALVPKMRL